MTTNDAISEVLAACGDDVSVTISEYVATTRTAYRPTDLRRSHSFAVYIALRTGPVTQGIISHEGSGQGDTIAEATRKAIASFCNPKLQEVA